MKRANVNIILNKFDESLHCTLDIVIAMDSVSFSDSNNVCVHYSTENVDLSSIF